MWIYAARRLLYNIPVFLGILAVVMFALRVNDPTAAHVGKNATQEQIDELRNRYGLNLPWYEQYWEFVKDFDLDAESWDKPGKQVGEIIVDAIPPTLAITVPALLLTAFLSIVIGLIAAFYRGKPVDRTLMVLAVVGMSVSFLVYIVFGQYYGAYKLGRGAVFAIQGYDTSHPAWWFHYCMLPVLISTIVAVGYDTRFYRTVMVEETTKDYIRTARAKGVSERRIMFRHMLRNASISIVTRIMITLPFLITGSILLEMYFGIPGMGRELITAITGGDFPVVQGFTAVFALFFIVTIILTDILYAVVDPRVRLS